MTDARDRPPRSDAALLDELVPPVRPRRHRIVSAAAILLAVVATWTASAGWIVPLTEGPELRGWGGTGPVHAVVHVGNDSPRPIEVTGLGPVPDGLSVLGYSTNPTEQWEDLLPSIVDEIFPLRLAPGEGSEIAVVYRVDDCAAVSGSDGPPTLEVRFPGPSGIWRHTRETPSPDPNRSWSETLTAFACPG